MIGTIRTLQTKMQDKIHTPDFYIDESGLKLGVRALARLAVNYLEMSEE